MMSFLISLKHFLQVFKFSFAESLRFIIDTEGYSGKEASEERKRFELTVSVHSLEKGLSFKNKKKGFGEEKAKRLVMMLERYIQNGYDTDDYSVYETVAILKAYLTYKESAKESIPDLESRLDWCVSKIDISKNYCKAGFIELNINAILWKDPHIIENFFHSTHSIRNYDKLHSVEENTIKEIIRLARSAPSACNRQSVHVYYTMERKKNELISDIVPGNNGFNNEIGNFLIVTSSKTFFGLGEYNQWYVDGGIFLAYLRLSIHALGLGSCTFQWTRTADERRLRQLCQIPLRESIIAIVGVGYLSNISYCIHSQRKAVDEYISKF